MNLNKQKTKVIIYYYHLLFKIYFLLKHQLKRFLFIDFRQEIYAARV